MQLQRLWLTDFRSYPSAELAFAPGLTALLGANGEGKTNLMEAVGYLATLSSFRGAPNDALVRQGCTTAVVRAEGEREGRSLLVEAEITTTGRGRVQVNKQRLSRARDLLGALRVSVFSPDDLELVKGGPAERRRYLDDALVARTPKLDVVRSDLDRVLRQRNALLRQSGGRLTPEVESTLVVWDAKLATAGEALADARADLVDDLAPVLAEAYDQVAGRPAHVAAHLRGPVAGHRAWPRPWKPCAPTSCDAASPWSVPTATSWRSRSTPCRRGPTPRRASSARWPWPCGWRRTGWSPTPPGRHRSCSSTTCSPSWTPSAAPPCWRTSLLARPCSRAPRASRPAPTRSWCCGSSTARCTPPEARCRRGSVHSVHAVGAAAEDAETPSRRRCPTASTGSCATWGARRPT